MAVIQKTSFAKDLDRFNVLVNDVNPNSRYFRITELPDTLTGGKNAFLIAGSEELVPDTKIQIERKVEETLGKYIHQSFTDLKFNASGDDKFRLGNINFVIDSGYKLKTIGDKTCKSIIGPFSIIDPASREINNDTRQINLHRENKTFDFTGGPACKLLNMHNKKLFEVHKLI